VREPEKIGRRDAVRTIASATILPVLPAANAQTSAGHKVESAASTKGWSPKFFTEDENQLVTVLAELILPETETPGAKGVGANQQIDLVLSEESNIVQRRFREGLAWIEGTARERHGSPFVKLTTEQQTAILNRVASRGKVLPEDEPGREFFLDIRHRTVAAYYTSRAGIHQELNYQGNRVLAEWTGCRHAGHHGDEG
jgi:hypothetical protein